MKIVVLAGGLSPERNVSLSSGAMVAGALRKLGHEVALVDLFFDVLDRFQTLANQEIPENFVKISQTVPDLAGLMEQREKGRASLRSKLTEDSQAVTTNTVPQSTSPVGEGIISICKQADIAYLALHGACGEDGRLQAMLDLEGICYTGSDYISSAIAMDKDLTKRLVSSKVSTPRWDYFIITPENLTQTMQAITLPAVVKPVDSGSSIGVSIVKTQNELEKALQTAIKLGGKTVVEEYISGREIQVAILDNRALPSIEIIIDGGFYDYENKYQANKATEICPSEISPALEQRLGQDALAVFQTIGLSVYARADFIVAEDGTPYFLEINTLPGMTPTSLVPQEAAADGISYEALCQIIVDKSLEARK